MQVKDLINLLTKEDPEALVLVDIFHNNDGDMVEAAALEQLKVYESSCINNVVTYSATYNEDPLGQSAIVIIG